MAKKEAENIDELDLEEDVEEVLEEDVDDEMNEKPAKAKKDLYEKEACEFKNETECEEDLDENMPGKELTSVEKEHFEEEEDSYHEEIEPLPPAGKLVKKKKTQRKNKYQK